MSSYDLLAHVYEQSIDCVMYEPYIDVLKAYKGTKTFLEVGCGTAYLSRVATRVGYQVTAVDVNDAMLDAASFYAGNEGLDIAFYKHDMRQRFKGKYGIVCMPVDVVNHMLNVHDLTQLFESAAEVLEPQGVLVFDYLHKAYMTSLMGYKEVLKLDGASYTWSVQQVSDSMCIQHTIESETDKATHQECYYEEQVLLEKAKAFVLEEKVVLKDRTILCLRKEK